MNLLILALTDSQMDQVIVLIGDSIKSIGAAIRTVWDTLSPVLMAYLLWRQALNRRVIEAKIDENTKVSTDALVVAKTIADKATVQEVHVVNDVIDPVKTDQI